MNLHVRPLKKRSFNLLCVLNMGMDYRTFEPTLKQNLVQHTFLTEMIRTIKSAQANTYTHDNVFLK